jgi:hypothetical protein
MITVVLKAIWVRKSELVGVGGGYAGLYRRLMLLFVSLHSNINLVM